MKGLFKEGSIKAMATIALVVFVVQGWSFSQDKVAFKSVVVVEYPRPDFLALAFLTGHIQDKQGKRYCKVFIPTSPNPTSGFFEIIPEAEVRMTSLTIEEGFKMIMSGGVVSYDIFK